MSCDPDAGLVRSWLFCPATAPERLPKALASGADAVIVDLEDAVAPDRKDVARSAAIAFFAAPAPADVVRCLRPNALRTLDGLRDLVALVETGTAPDFLVLPKVESAEEVAVVDALLAGPCATTRLLPLVESSRGLEVAGRVAAHPRVAGLVLGGAD